VRVQGTTPSGPPGVLSWDDRSVQRTGHDVEPRLRLSKLSAEGVQASFRAEERTCGARNNSQPQKRLSCGRKPLEEKCGGCSSFSGPPDNGCTGQQCTDHSLDIAHHAELFSELRRPKIYVPVKNLQSHFFHKTEVSYGREAPVGKKVRQQGILRRNS
jgi:hypothetical protein